MTAAFLVVLSASGWASSPKTLALFCAGPHGHQRYCYGIFEEPGGQIDFRIGSFSFTGAYKLCVRDPSRHKVCRRWRLARSCACSIKRWKPNFPHSLTGTYRVQWRRGGHALGPALSFQNPPH